MADSRLSTEQQVRTLWRLGGLTWPQLLRRTLTEMQNDDILGRASELAFNFVMAVFPALIFLLSLLGIFASHAAGVRDQLFHTLPYVLPIQAADLVIKTINEVTQASGSAKLTFGAVLALWAATGGTSSMISGLNAAYDVRD